MKVFACALAAAAAVNAPLHATQRFFVDADAPPGGDGTSWATAFADLQDGLAAAGSSGGPAQVWVAEGVYRPDRGTLDRSASFGLMSGVAIYGGFDGTESDLFERDPGAHPTVLSGDLLGDDQPGFVDIDENSEHVVNASGVDDTAILDGFTIRGGNANIDGVDASSRVGGGGLFGDEAGPTIIGCTFEGNSAGRGEPTTGFFGGAVLLRNRLTAVQPRFERCEFSGNRAVSAGALAFQNSDRVLYQEFTEFDLRVVDCRFVGNSAADQIGGAVSVGGSPFNTEVRQSVRFERCVFEDNHAAYAGALIVSNSLEFRMVDCDLVGNSADVYAGGLWHIQTAQTDVHPAQLVRCTFEDNSVSGPGAAVFLGSTSADIVACSFLGNTAERGGGVFLGAYAFGCGERATVVDSVFSGNTAGNGGGIYVHCSPGLVIADSTFATNAAGAGAGGLYIDDANVRIAGSVFWNNASGGSHHEGAQVTHGGGGLVEVDYTLVQNLTGALGGQGNIDADPLFADAAGPDGVAGTADDDLRLSAGSPAVDAANNNLVPADSADLDGDGDVLEPVPLDREGLPRFVDDVDAPDTGVGGNGHDAVVDMGAYEGAGGCAADFDGDGEVNSRDFIAFLNAFAAGDTGADFNGDGIVDSQDFIAFLNAFVTGC